MRYHEIIFRQKTKRSLFYILLIEIYSTLVYRNFSIKLVGLSKRTFEFRTSDSLEINYKFNHSYR